MNHYEIASTIIEQIGPVTLSAIGASSVYQPVPEASGGVIIRFRDRRVKVLLNDRDLYDVELWRVTRGDVAKVTGETDVHADSLLDTIKSMLRDSGYDRA